MIFCVQGAQELKINKVILIKLMGRKRLVLVVIFIQCHPIPINFYYDDNDGDDDKDNNTNNYHVFMVVIRHELYQFKHLKPEKMFLR